MRLFLLLISIFTPFISYCQIQQGYVKTQGRPNKPGVALSGVTVRWRGNMNTILSNDNGRFNAAFPDKKDGDAISLISVRKDGYELIDKDLIGRQLVFSIIVPIEIVMVSSAELEANRKRISDNAYRKAEATYQSKLELLERQKEESEISIEQYRKQLQQLQDNYEKYVSLIEGMADRYARTDYDHLDSLDREINLCIENGELDKADSLIHTVFDPTTVLERNRAAKAEIQARIQLAQEIIDKANTDMEAICCDSAYAKRVIILSDNLAQEYLSQGERQKARECLMQSLVIRQILYGEEHKEIKRVKQIIQSLQ